MLWKQTMKKRVPLGVHKKKPFKRNKKRFLKKVLDYFKSDSYMFGPLISSPPSDLSAPKMTCSSSTATGVVMKEPIKENKKRLLKKVGEYLKSDTYMYASLIEDVLQPSHPSTGPFWHLRRVTTAILTRKILKKYDQPTEQPKNVTAEDQPSGGLFPETSIVGQQRLLHLEMVKHIVHQNCHSSSMPGKGMLESPLRELHVK